MPDSVFTLLDEYAAAYARGDRPEARDYLERAGGEADELARLIDSFLSAVPAPDPDAETVELFEGWLAGDSPLLRLRVARGVTRDRAVDALVDRLDLDRQKWAKVKRYYHQLESGVLDPAHVDRRVFDVLAKELRTRTADLLAWRPRPLAVEIKAAYRQAAEPPSIELTAPVAAASKADEGYDEIDRLFLGRR